MEDADRDVWLEYLSAKRESYLVERKRLLGPEYALDPQRWDALLEQEWLIMRDRLAAGHDVEDPIKRQLGEDFFERQLMEQLESEFHQVASDFEEIQWQDKFATVRLLRGFHHACPARYLPFGGVYFR